jgi:hypothetical protein
MSNLRLGPSGPVVPSEYTIRNADFSIPAIAVIPAASVYRSSVAVLGALSTDIAVGSLRAALAVNLEFSIQAVTADTIHFSITNPTAGPLAFPSSTVSGALIRF